MWVLRLVSLLYFVSACWCLLNVELAAKFLGYHLNQQGLSEFFTVYGGLQMGIAWAMLLSSFKQDFIAGALFFSSVLSSVLAGFRFVSMGIYGWSDGGMAMGILEITLALMLILAFYRFDQKNTNA